MSLIHVSLLPAFALFLVLASAQPVLQPNEHYVKVGREQAEKDIRTCSKMARSMDAPGSEAARSTGGSSRDLFSTPGRRDPQYQGTVERCLQNKGYTVAGWE